MSLTSVDISAVGIVRNITSLNYTHQTAVKEYLNNVLEKNVRPDYSIKFNLKDINRNTFMFECVEQNACGFTTLDEVRSAFMIAESERVGANNMGYGIYSPITINKDHEAYGLFIQNNANGSFYSIVYFGSAHSKIWKRQGEILDDRWVEGQDVSAMIVRGGTRSVWITKPDNSDAGDDVLLDADQMVRIILKFFRKSLTVPNKEDDTEADIMELGKYYNYYLADRETSISYGDKPLLPIDILQEDVDRAPKQHEYQISVMSYDGKKSYRIEDEEGSARNFTKNASNPIGEIAIRRNHARHQLATVTIHDIDLPNEEGRLPSDAKRSRKLDRKVWVKIGETYIFCEDFPLNGYPNIRVVIELNNTGNNDFDDFISPDANKSNSKINNEIKDRINGLIKYTIKQYFRGSTGRVQISDTLKHEAWEAWFGNKCRGECSAVGCGQEMTAWKYGIERKLQGAGDVVDNLRPICKLCIKKQE